VAISVDAAEDSQELVEDEQITIPLLSDPDMTVIKAYGVAMEGEDIAVPATFVVRQDRTIHWKHIGETMADRPPTDELPALAEQAR
jgi:peroxiredoxin